MSLPQPRWWVNFDHNGNKIHRAECGFVQRWATQPKWRDYSGSAEAEAAALEHPADPIYCLKCTWWGGTALYAEPTRGQASDGSTASAETQ